MLMFVGFSMLKSAKNIDFEDVTEFVPAVAALIFMAITYSILNGIALAFVMYGVLKIVTLRYKELSFMNVVFFIMFSFYLFVMR
jgi:AGZA family xanthine/uracil permease-like MFS transporter